MTDLARTTFLMAISTKAQRQDVHTVSFFYDGDDSGADPQHGLRLDKDVWEDMGSPTTITVAIWPGDKLNEEGSHEEG